MSKKKKNQNKKSRNIRYSTWLRKGTEGAYVEIFSEDSTTVGFRLRDRDNNIINLEPGTKEIFYNRENGKEKVLLTQPDIETSMISINPNYEFAQYDYVVAIDTSHIQHNETVYAFTGCVQYLKDFIDENHVEYIYKSDLFEWDATGVEKIENCMYAQVISLLNSRYSGELKDNQIAILVDCNLGAIEKINSRVAPIYEDYFLPEGFRLLYTSSDAGSSDYLPNKLFALSDKVAKDGFKRFKERIINGT